MACASYAERAAYLHKAADILERDAEKIGQVLSKEISKGLNLQSVKSFVLLKSSTMQLKKVCVWKVKYLKVVHLTQVARKKIAVVRREPVGLVLAISPFNYPVNLAGSKIAPALICW